MTESNKERIKVDENEERKEKRNVERKKIRMKY